MAEKTDFSIPQCIIDTIGEMGYTTPGTAMNSYIQLWDDMFKARGEFWDYNDRDADGRAYKVHRMSIKPAKRVASEWASLLLNDDTQVRCEEQACTDWLQWLYNRINFTGNGQDMVMRAFALGTGAWAMWVNTETASIQLRRYDARQVVPLSWDDDGVSECAFVSRMRWGGKDYDQLQMHLKGEDGYTIRTFCYDENAKLVQLEGLLDELQTHCPTPTFAVVKPALANTCVDNSPYGISVYEDAIDVLKSVDEAYDAIFNEIRLGKMRVFMDDMLMQKTEGKGGAPRAVPFGKDDMVVFRTVAGIGEGIGNAIKEYAPTLRVDAILRAYRTALQTIGDKCGFGLNYFDIDDAGGIKTATEVSSDNSALMRNIRRHENLLQGAIAQISRAAVHFGNEYLGQHLPDPGEITVNFDDSIITDTASEKQQDMAEVNVTMNPWEYRMKWYGEDEATAKANAPRGYVEPAFPASDDEGEFGGGAGETA